MRCTGPYFRRESLDTCSAMDKIAPDPVGLYDIPIGAVVILSGEAASRRWMALGEVAVGALFTCMCILVYYTYVTVSLSNK